MKKKETPNLNQSEHSKEEVEELGYDWAVVKFFQENYPDLLLIMWGHISSAHHWSILSNTISDEDLNEHLGSQNFMNEKPFRTLSTKAMIEFRNTISKKRVEKRPPNEVEINAAIERLSNGEFKSISDASPGLWTESPDEEKQTTTFSYRGIDLPGYTFEVSWIEMKGSSSERVEEMPPLP